MQKIRLLASTLLLIATLLTTCVLAQTNLTQIRDTINNPDGTPFNGTVVITWNGSSTTLSGTVSPLSTSARIYNGALSVLLVPTTTAGGNSYYQVVYSSSDGTTQWTETWQVPPSSNALSVAGVRTSSSTGGGSGVGTGTGPVGQGTTQYATLPIAMSQVTGLSSSLSSLTTSVTANTSAIATLQSSSTTLNTTVSGLQSSYTTLNNTVTGMQTANTALNNTVTGLQSSYTTLNNTVGGVQSSITGLNSSVTGLTTSYNQMNTSVTGLQTSLGTTNSNVTSLQTSVNSLTTMVNALSAASGTSQVAFVDGDPLSGVINGSNSAFALSATPSPATSLALYRNGMLQQPGADFTLSGSTVTFLSSSVPKTGDKLEAFYRIVGSGATPSFIDGEIPGGTINGSNVAFTLAAAPVPALSLEVFKNGVLLAQGDDYTLAGAAITFSGPAVPQSGDSLTAYYRH